MKRVVLLLVLAQATSARADDPAPTPPEEQAPRPPAAAPEEQAPPPRKTPFDRGRIGLSVGAGSQNAFGANYFVVGGGVGYFVLDGVELGLSALHQFGPDPTISKVSPSLRYVAQPLVGKWPIIPYVGAFYNHWFIGGNYSDVDTVGSRAGFLYVSGSIILGLGVAVERYLTPCPMDTSGEHCFDVYPDFTLSLAL